MIKWVLLVLFEVILQSVQPTQSACFENHVNQTAIGDLFNTTAELDPPESYFLLGSNGDSLADCESACLGNNNCVTFSHFSLAYNDSEWAGYCVGSSMPLLVDDLESDDLVTSGLFYVCPDIKTVEFIIDFPSTEVYQDVLTDVTVSVTITNGATHERANIEAQTGLLENFELTLIMTNYDISRAGVSHSMDLPPVYPEYTNDEVLSHGLPIADAESIHIDGEAQIFVPADSCLIWNYVCAFVKGGSRSGLLDTDLVNNHRCQDISSIKQCTNDHIDFSVQQFDIIGNTLYSGGFSEMILAVKIDISGNFVLAPNPDTVTQDYGIILLLSDDNIISLERDLQISTEFIDNKVTKKFTQSGSLVLTVPNLKLPQLESVAANTKYCGLQYLGVIVDPQTDGSDSGVIVETHEDNVMAIPVKVLCEADKWALSDVKFMTETVYMSTDQVITVDVTVHNLQRRTYIGGTAAFTLALCLYDEEIYGTGSNELELYKVGSVTYLDASPLSPIAEAGELVMKGVQFYVEASQFTSDPGYTHIILKVEPTEGTDLLLSNSYFAQEVNIDTSNPDPRVTLSGGFDVAETHLLLSGMVTTDTNITLTGQISLGSTDPNSLNLTLFWSKDNQLDNSDINSDLVIRVNASGDMVVEETLLSPPSDKTFCGRVYGILLNHPPTYIPDYSLYNDDRLAVTSSSVVLACDDATTDKVALMGLEIIQQPNRWISGQRAYLAIEIRVACTAQDCSTTTLTKDNFALFLDTDRSKDGTETQHLLNNNEFSTLNRDGTVPPTSLNVQESLVLQRRIAITYDYWPYCQQHYRFLRLELIGYNDYEENNHITVPVRLQCLTNDSMDIITDIQSIDTPSNNTGFEIEVTVRTHGNFELPKTDWPHMDMKFYLCAEQMVDPSGDCVEVPFMFSQCQRQDLSLAVTDEEVILIRSGLLGYLKLPDHGFESLCQYSNVYLGVAFDTRNILPLLDVYSSRQADSAPINTIDIGCVTTVDNRELSAEFYGDNSIPEDIYPHSVYTMNLKVKVKNMHTSGAFIGSNDRENPDYGMEIFLAKDGVIDASSIPFDITISEDDESKRGLGIGAGSFQTFEIEARLPFDRFTIDDCEALNDGLTQLVVEVVNVTGSGGFTASSTLGAADVLLICNLKLTATNINFDMEKIIWQDLDYNVDFTFDVVHEGQHRDLFSTETSNFEVSILLVSNGRTLALNLLTLTDSTVQTTKLENNESVMVSGSGTLHIEESGTDGACADFTGSRFMEVHIKPQGILREIGYADTVTEIDVTSALNVECSDDWLDMQVTSVGLQDANGNEIPYMEVGGASTTVRLEIYIDVGPSGTNYFTSGIRNYEYDFYLSRTPDDAEYKIDYAATNDELEELVPSDRDVILTAADVQVPDNADTQSLCGSVYLIPLLRDLRNDPAARRRRSVISTVNFPDDVIGTKDPKLRNSYHAQPIVLRCPSDLFGMSDVTMISTQAVLMDSATIEFSAVLTNSHAQGYDIPVSVNGLSNIDFKIMDNADTEIGLKDITFADEDIDKVNGIFEAGTTITLSSVTITLDIDNSFCTLLQTGSWQLQVIPGVGLPAGFVDKYNSNDKLTMAVLPCESNAYNLQAVSATGSATSSTRRIEFDLVVQVLPESHDVLDARAADIEMFINGISFGATVQTTTNSPSGDQITLTRGLTVPVDQWENICGMRSIELRIDSSNNVIEPNENDNSITMLVPVPCDNDLYTAYFNPTVMGIIYPDIPTTFYFDAAVYNLQSSAISAAGENSPDNFVFKVYAQEGDILDPVQALDVSPVWRYSSDYAATAFFRNQQSSLNSGMLSFNEIYSDFTLPSDVCTLGFDHLFLTVESTGATLQNENDPYEECLFSDNYVAIPFECASASDGIDLAITSLRTGIKLFSLEGGDMLILGEDVTFSVEVTVTTKGSGYLEINEEDGVPPFEFAFTLENSQDGLNEEMSNTPVTAVTYVDNRKVIIAGVINLDPETFLMFCDNGGTLTISIDPNNQIEEMDNLNNEAKIDVLVLGGGNNYCNGLDLIPELLYIDPGPVRNTVQGEAVIVYKFSYRIKKTTTVPDPEDFYYRVVISIDGDLDNPTNRNLTGVRNHIVANGLDVQFTEQISILRRDDVANRFNHLFCGHASYFCLLVNSDNNITEINYENNVLCRQFRMECAGIEGIAVSNLTLKSTSSGSVITSGSNTVTLQVDVLNKGLKLSNTDPDLDIVRFNLYAASKSNLDNEQALTTTWSNYDNLEIVELSVNVFDDLEATFTLTHDACIITTHLCVEVVQDDGMPGDFADDFAGDNYFCYDLINDEIRLDCGRDISVSNFDMNLPYVTHIYKDVAVDVAFNVTLQLNDQPFELQTDAYLGVEISICDQNALFCTNDFNDGSHVLLVHSEDVMWNEESREVLKSRMGDGDENTLSGTAQVLVPGEFCSASVGARYICLKWVALMDFEPPVRDTNDANDYQCLEASTFLDCSEDTVDLVPTRFDLGNAYGIANTYRSFNLEVEVRIGSEDKEGAYIFRSQIILSTDWTVDSSDIYLLDTEGFQEGQALAEMQKVLKMGTNYINIGFNGFVLPRSDILGAHEPSLCGDIVVFANTDIDNQIAETDENNGLIGAPFTIVCLEDAFLLSEVSLEMAGKTLYAGEDSFLYFDMTAMNMQGDYTPLPSPSADNFNLVIYAVWIDGAGDEQSSMIASEMTYPSGYYNKMMPYERRRYEGVQALVQDELFTIATCRSTTHLRFRFVPSVVDLVANHEVTVPFPMTYKKCNAVIENTQLRMAYFSSPNLVYLPSQVYLQLAMTIRIGASELETGSFIYHIYVSRDASLDPNDDYQWKENSNSKITSSGQTLLDGSTGIALQVDDAGYEYCGHTHLFALLDTDNDLIEPNEETDWHQASSETTFICLDDHFGISDVSFETEDQQIRENKVMAFKLEVTVTCTKENCDVPKAVENILFRLTTKTTSTSPESTLVTINSNWGNVNEEQSITPSLGAKYQYVGYQNKFEIHGTLMMGPGGCSETGENLIMVNLDFGFDLSTAEDSVLENNIFTIKYSCVQESSIDLVLSAFNFFDGEKYKPDKYHKFKMDITLEGEAIEANEAAPTLSPFALSFWISKYEDVSGNSYHLNYETSESFSKVINQGINQTLLVVPDYKGLYIPSGFCGFWYIIAQIDSKNNYTETSEDNNFESVLIYIDCDDDVLAVDVKANWKEKQIFKNQPATFTMDITVQNLGPHALLSSSDASQPMKVMAALSINDVIDPLNDLFLDVELNEDNDLKLKQQIERFDTILLESVKIEVNLQDAAMCEMYKYLIVGILLTGNATAIDDYLDNNFKAIPLNTYCSDSPDLAWVESAEMLNNMYLLESDGSTTITYTGKLNVTVPPGGEVEHFMVFFYVSDDDKLDRDQDDFLSYQLGSEMHDYMPFQSSQSVSFEVVANFDEVTRFHKYCQSAYIIMEIDLYGEVIENNLENNIQAEKIPSNCKQTSNVDIVDMFGVSNISVRVRDPITEENAYPTWPNLTYLYNIDLTVECYQNCPDAAVSGTLAFSTHYTIDIKVCDSDLVCMASFHTPIDAYWVSASVENADSITATALQHAFDTSSILDVEIEGSFSVSPGDMCERVSYLAVVINRGDSDQVDESTWGNVANDIKYIPWRFHCEDPVDLQIQSFGINGETSSVSLDLSTLSTLDLSLEVSTRLGYWPEYVQNKPMFNFKLVLSDVVNDEYINLMYDVPNATYEKLITDNTGVDSIDLSEAGFQPSEAMLSTLARACSIGTINIGVIIDTYNVVLEETKSNNKEFIAATVTGCTEYFNLIMNNIDFDAFVVSGSNMDFELDLTFNMFGSNQEVDTDEIENIDVAMEIYNKDGNKVRSMEPMITTPTYNETAIISSSSQVISLNNILYNGSVTIPGDYIFCGHSWLIKTSIYWKAYNESFSRDNYKWKHIFIECPVDILALVSFEFGRDISAESFSWWPILSVNVPVQLTVKNMDSDYKENSTTGLFSIDFYFSTDDYLNKTSDHKTTVQSENGGDALINSGINGDAILKTEWLTGILEVPSMIECSIVANEMSESKPTLFVAINVPDPELSPFMDNDYIAQPLDPAIFNCIEDQVDLSVEEFSISLSDVPPNTEISYRLRVGIYKTSSALIAQSDPSDDEDLSISITMCLSLDRELTSDDVKIPLELSNNQRLQLRQGVAQALYTPAEYTLDGDLLKFDLEGNQNWYLYCGEAYLLVQVSDLKNIPSIDPDMTNNIIAYKMHLDCQFDSWALDNFSIKSIYPQDIIYSGTNVVVDLTVFILYYQTALAKSTNPNYHLEFYMSPDRSLNTDLDSKVPVTKGLDDIYAKAVDLIPSNSPIEISAPIEINIPFSACTSRYLILSIHKGVDVLTKDNIFDDNLRYVDIYDFLKCSVNFVDFSVQNFVLLDGDNIQTGQELTFQLSISIALDGTATVGNGVDPVMNFQFFLSTKQILDESAINLNYTGKEQMAALTNTFYGSIYISANSQDEKIIIPAVHEEYYGDIYLLVLLDADGVNEEQNEYNNVYPHPVKMVGCNDVLQLKVEKVTVPSTLEQNWNPVELSFTVTNLLDSILTAMDNPVFDIKVYVQRNTSTTRHDITPISWRMFGQDIGSTFAATSSMSFTNIGGDVDITLACYTGAKFEWVVTGPVKLVIEITPNQYLSGPVDAVMANNRHSVDVNVDCEFGSSSLDLGAEDFSLDNGPTLELGPNDYTLNGFTRITGGDVGTGFMHSFIVAAGGISRVIDSSSAPYENTLGGEFEITAANGELDLTSGFDFLCSFPGDIELTAVLDRTDSVQETNNMNNDATLSGLNVDPAHCTDGIDIAPEEFVITNLDIVVARPEERLEFTLRVSVTARGNSGLLSLSGDDMHFSFMFILSDDDIYDEQTDYLFEPEELSAEQLSGLQASVSSGSTAMLTLNGANLIIPLNKDSHPYCWEHPYIGVLIQTNDNINETTTDNNAKFFRIVLDCGVDLDECTMDLASCSEFADCIDLQYDIYTYIGQPYECECKEGFQANGDLCEDINECTNALCSALVFSECNNYDGGYECLCMTGYQEDFDSFGRLSGCVDRNECLNSTWYNCNANASCLNNDGSYSCQCLEGFSGDGVENCTDIIDCTSDSCQNNGTCIEGVMGFTCACLEGHEGNSCEKVHGEWSEWTAWSDCAGECDMGYSRRTRECNNPEPANGGRRCSRREGRNAEQRDCLDRGCHSGHIPWANYDPCFSQHGGGINLYIDSGSSYSCDCQIGYTKLMSSDDKFKRCLDDDECTITDDNGYNIHDCNENAACVNVLGDFECHCNTGYTGDGRTCEDVDECLDPNTCPNFTDCSNTVGSFTCTCSDGYKVDDDSNSGTVSCLEDRLFAYGTDEGDNVVTIEDDKSTLTKERASVLIRVPQQTALFGGLLCPSVYISENGLVVITDETIDYEGRETYRYPRTLNDTIFDGSESYVKGLLAVWWVDANSESRFHKIYYQAYTETSNPIFIKAEQLLLEGVGVHFYPDFILKVTWFNMAPMYASDPSERSTVQFLLITNGIHTYSVYIYDDGAMRWNPSWMNGYPSLLHEYNGFPARIGYAIRGPTGRMYLEENENSGQFSIFEDRLNAYRISEKVMQDHGKKGILIYQLDDNPNTFENSLNLCDAWYENEGDISVWSSDIINTCPYNMDQAQDDDRLQLLTTSTQNNITCYQRTLVNIHGASFKCCYHNGDKSIVDAPLSTNYEEIGFLTKYAYAEGTDNDYYNFDVLPHDWCCLRSNDESYCDKYKTKRPIMTSENYVHVMSALALGSVHMKTLDKADLNILGYGEYVAFRSKPTSSAPPIMIQLRTDISYYQASESTKAVIISAVSAKAGTRAPSLQAYLDSNGTGIDVWVDGEIYTNQTLVDAWVMRNSPSSLSRRRRSSDSSLDQLPSVTFVFELGISVTAYVDNRQLYVLIRVPDNIPSSLMEGLLGNMDGDASDDFMTSTGDTFNSDSSAEEIFSYTETWILRNLFGVTNADSNTIFSHYTNPTSANNYFRAAFTPDIFGAADYSSQILETCTVENSINWECAYDYAVTGRNTLELYTVFAVFWNNVGGILSNSPPRFDRNVPLLIEAKLGVTETITIKAMDTGPVTIGITILNLETNETIFLEPGSTEFNSEDNVYTAIFSWLPEIYKAHIIYTAVDTYGARSTLTPEYILCRCEHELLCDHSQPTYFLGNFRYGLCKCIHGYSGQFCTEDLDGCKVKHCDGTCTDKTPSEVQRDYLQSEFSCEECPPGFEGDGNVCTDINECVLPSSNPARHNCDHNCDNTAGGFSCSCGEGYTLDTDEHSCYDTQDCGTNRDNCDHIHGTCTDGAGTFSCGCQPGYEMSHDGVTCVDIDECSTNNGNCSKLCVNSPGAFYCDCGYGYEVGSANQFICNVIDLCDLGYLCDHTCINRTAWYECDCNSGFTLQDNDWQCLPTTSCSEVFAQNTCDNLFGLCSFSNGETSCSCQQGYQLDSDDRRTCVSINECTTGEHSCGTNSECVNQEGEDGSYECRCNSGYRHSIHSESECLNIDECAENSTFCKQICIDSPGYYSCDCKSGYQLADDYFTCIDIDECDIGVSNLCDVHATCTNLNGSHVCTCVEGFTGNGLVCDEADECMLDNGDCDQVCHNTDGSFYCSCLDGYTLDLDRINCVDIDECIEPSMKCDQGCQNLNGSYQCTCLDGFTLNADGSTCSTDYPCTSFLWCGPQDDGNQCTAVSGSPECVCGNGYTYNEERNICEDVDECTTLGEVQSDELSRKRRSVNNTIEQTTETINVTTSITTTATNQGIQVTTQGIQVTTPGIQVTTPGIQVTTPGIQLDYVHNCVGPTASCENVEGSYSCVCQRGYGLRGDGLSCMDIDECVNPDPLFHHNCDVNNTICINTAASYRCECREGYKIDSQYSCIDIDECDLEDVDELTCHQHAICDNYHGGFTCSCKSGFMGDGLLCQDIDECNRPTLNTCTANQACTNFDGGFSCQCQPGYQTDVALDQCVDINECDSTSLNPCVHTCENIVGSFRCTCPDGYQINPFDGQSCQIAEQCDSANMRQACQHDCVRRNNADYCSCNKGYTKDELLCHDIDECTTTSQTDAHKCGDNSECKNLNGTYECVCLRYYIKDSDGLACSQTNGNHGAWSNWSPCSAACHGIRTRTRNCNAPPPTEGRECEGGNVERQMCKIYYSDCRSLEEEVAKGVYVDFMDLIPELWESIRDGFIGGLKISFNFFCWESAENYEQCCNRPLSDNNILQLRRDFVKNSDIKLGRGYPREKSSGSRILLYIEMPVDNDLCGDLSIDGTIDPNITIVDRGTRKKRDTGETYVLPREFLIEIINATETRDNIELELNQQNTPEIVAAVDDYIVSEAYFEDTPTTTPPPLEDDSNLNIVVVILAVIFSVFGITVLGFVLFILVRPSSMENKKIPEDGVKGTALQMFGQKEEEELNSEDEA